MKAATDRRASVRFWVVGAFVVLLSIASAVSYFGYVGQEVIAGDLFGLRGREADVALAQQRATYWLITSLFCLTGKTLTVALALPICVDAPRLPRFIARFRIVATSRKHSDACVTCLEFVRPEAEQLLPRPADGGWDAM
jgi:hypothetical protein